MEPASAPSPKRVGLVKWGSGRKTWARVPKEAAPEAELSTLGGIIGSMNARSKWTMGHGEATALSPTGARAGMGMGMGVGAGAGPGAPAAGVGADGTQDCKLLLHGFLDSPAPGSLQRGGAGKRRRESRPAGDMRFTSETVASESLLDDVAKSNDALLADKENSDNSETDRDGPALCVPAPLVREPSFDQSNEDLEMLHLLDRLESELVNGARRQTRRGAAATAAAAAAVAAAPAAAAPPATRAASMPFPVAVTRATSTVQRAPSAPELGRRQVSTKEEIEAKKRAAIQRREQLQQKQQQPPPPSHQQTHQQHGLAAGFVLPPASVTACSRRSSVSATSACDEKLFDELAIRLAEEAERATQQPSAAARQAAELDEEASLSVNPRILPPFSASSLLSEQGDFQRFKVIAVREEAAEGQPALSLDVVSRPGDRAARIELRGVWAVARPQSGDYVNVRFTCAAPQWRRGEPIVVDEQQHLFVLCPDLLVAPTSIATAVTCPRRAVLAMHTKSFSPSQSSVLGNLKHELVERAMMPYGGASGALKPDVSAAYLRRVGLALVKARPMVEQLFAAGLTQDSAMAALHDVVPALQALHAAHFLAPGSSARAGRVDLKRGLSGALVIDEVVATEQLIISPLWGLKGKPDMLVRGSLSKVSAGSAALFPSAQAAQEAAALADRASGLLFPLELKTGSRGHDVTHDAQVQLYSLLMTDRYNSSGGVAGGPALPGTAGLLLHMCEQKGSGAGRGQQQAQVTGVPVQHHVLVHLLAKRNEFAQAYAPDYLRGQAVESAAEAALAHRQQRRPQYAAEGRDRGGCAAAAAGASLESSEGEAEAEAEAEAETDGVALAAALVNASNGSLRPLPPVLGNVSNVCGTCYEKQSCMVFHVALEGGCAASSGLPQSTLDSLVGDLSPAHKAYFREWNAMLDLEESTNNACRREVWTMAGPEREARGRCIADLRLVSTRLDGVTDTSRAFLSTFQRAPQPPAPTPSPPAHKGPQPVANLSFELDEYVSISIEGQHHQVAEGRIAALGHDTVVVRTGQPVPLPARAPGEAGAGRLAEQLRWRVDKNLLFEGLAAVKTNLVQLMKATDEMARLRALLVDLEAPRFEDDKAAGKSAAGWLRGNLELPGSLWSGRFKLKDVRTANKLKALMQLEKSRLETCSARPTPPQQQPHEAMTAAYARLNEDQRRAVASVLAAQDYVCIHGMPGTGKSSTIVFIVRALRALGCSVLVTAYQHSALDSLLVNLSEAGDCPFFRAGDERTAHPRVRGRVLANAAPSVEALSALEHDPQLVLGATCLTAARHPLVAKRRFDFCIVDEAGQLTQPVCLGPIMRAGVFVLVGDDHQLPPLVKSETAKAMGMDRSILSRLTEAQPGAVAKLTLQFRMNEDIMQLANHLIYKGQLRCGSDRVARQRLDELAPPALGEAPGEPWLCAALDPSRSVVFIDTDLVADARERRAGLWTMAKPPPAAAAADDAAAAAASSSSSSSQLPSLDVGLCSQVRPQAGAAQESNGGNDPGAHHGKLENDVEARVVRCLLGGLVRGGVSAEQVGVISPYRSQLRLLERHLEPWCAAGTEIQTVDRYQGRDKDVIVISLVRSNAKKDVGGLLRDWRRINVAFTRAKKKLLVVGSRTTLEASPVFSSFLVMVTQRGWLLALPSASRLLLAGDEADAQAQLEAQLEAQRSPWRKKHKPGRGPPELVPPALAAGLPVSRDVCLDVVSEYE